MHISYSRTLVGVVVMVCFAAALPLAVSAADVRTGEQVSVGAGETINSNAYMAGGNVSSAGPIRGDLVIAGGTLLVTSALTGDLLAGGGTITVTGDVSGDSRVGGGTITLQGKVGGDLVVGGGQITVTGAGIGGDAMLGGGSITLSAPVQGSVKIGGGDVKIDAPIHGNVEVQAGTLTLGSKAVIDGNLTYAASKEAVMESGAEVKGKVDFKKAETNTPSKAAVSAIFSVALLIKLITSFVCALVFALIFPLYARELSRTVGEKPLESLGKGFVSLIVIPAASIVLLLTVFGIPLGILGLIGFVGLMIFAALVTPVVAGSLVHKWIWKPSDYVVDWKTVLMGVLIYTLLGVIPFAGWILKFILILMTLGVSVGVKWDMAKKWR